MSVKNILVVLSFLVFFGRCSSCESLDSKPCTESSECVNGRVCVGGVCQSPALADAGKDAGGGTSDGGVASGCSPDNPANAVLDSDCDGLSDDREYSAFFAGGQQTDPCKADTDGDGLLDGLELGATTSVDARCVMVADADPSSQTNPTRADTDQDGLSDGAEDKNQNGQVDDDESNPIRKDSDCDGLTDDVELSGARGCITHPARADSDNDGLPDGVEQGLIAAPAGVSDCAYGASTLDADKSTRTNACAQDSDGDGVMDGAEDNNFNGRVDVGELDPNLASDSTATVQAACATPNLRPIQRVQQAVADVQVALSADYTEVSTLKDAAGKERGLIFYDPTHQVVGLALSKLPSGTSAVAEETAARNIFKNQGALSGALTQTFTTWDGFASSVRANYDYAGTADLKARINALAEEFLGAGVTGQLPGAAGIQGPFKLYSQFVVRTPNRAVVLLAMKPASLFDGNAPFHLDDVAGGSALAQFGDFAAAQCEVFLTQGENKLDFIWVVDNSASMGVYQGSVGNVGSLFSQKLGNAGLDWRVAGIATDGDNSTPFVTNINLKFFTDFGTRGNTYEVSLTHARNKVESMLPTQLNNPLKIRSDADLHVILFGDADDGTFGVPVSDYIDFFKNYDGSGKSAMVHGIVCPANEGCGEMNPDPRRNLAVIAGTGGVLGDINSAAVPGDPATANTLDAILNAAIVATGQPLSRPPITASLKVAMEAGASLGACNTADVPRSRINGFDVDGATRRLVFYGSCKPNAAGKQVAVSYRYWNEKSPYPGGDPCDNRCVSPQVCNVSTQQCQCASDCGGCPESLFCNPESCSCVGLQ